MGLMLSSQCDVVTKDQLRMISCFPKSETHEPIKHIDFLESIEKAIERSGFIELTGTPELGVSKDGEHFFGFMDIITRTKTHVLIMRNLVTRTRKKLRGLLYIPPSNSKKDMESPI